MKKLNEFSFTTGNDNMVIVAGCEIIIKALETLVWHLSREQMKEMTSLKK